MLASVHGRYTEWRVSRPGHWYDRRFSPNPVLRARADDAGPNGVARARPFMIGGDTMRRGVLVFVIAGVFSFVAWSFRDPEMVTGTLERLSPRVVLALLLVLSANEAIKAIRWAWYLRAAQLPLRFRDSITSYLAAQAASALPGGSILSARLAEEHAKGRIGLRHTAPPLIAQGLGDVFAVALLALIGIAASPQPNAQLVAPVAALILALLLITIARSERSGTALVGVLRRWRLTRRLVPVEEDARRTLVALLNGRALIPGTMTSIASSLCAVAILIMLANALTVRGLAPLEGLYVHGMSMLAHLFLPVPNGFGTTEISLVGLLNWIGIGFGRATAIAITYRALGIGFRTLIGLAVLLLRYHHLIQLRSPAQPVPTTLLDVASEASD